MSLRSAVLLAAAAAFAFSAAGIPVRASYGAQTTADEPHYLLTALSLAEDRSLDVSDEISARRYLPWSEVGLNRQAEAYPDGSLISPHDPLLPAFLAPAFALGAGWVGAKLLLCLVAAVVAGLTVWVAVRRLEADPLVAGVVAALFGATVPLGVYGNQVYPEITAALATLVAVAALTGPLGRRAVWVVTLAVTLLPWLSIKYAPVAFALAFVCALRLWTEHPRRVVYLFVLTLGLSGLVFVVAHLWWYGGVTPYAAGDHFASTGEFSVIGTNVDLLGRSRRLIGLLIDDKFGLAAWQPAWLFAVPALVGAVLMRTKHGFGRSAFLAPLAAGWLNATFVALTMQGFWFPGRQVVVVLPLIVVLMAVWASRSAQRFFALGLIAGLGVFSIVWLLIEGHQERITWVVDFFETRGPFYRAWQSVLPDYLGVTAMTWVLHSAWLLLLGGWAYGALRAGREEGRGLPRPSRPSDDRPIR